MKALIIYAHPATGGHNEEMLKATKKQLVKRKINFETIDLYKIKYDPVLHENEHPNAKKPVVSNQNKAIQKKIKKAGLLVFIYPVWWSTMPAIMKGFFDKVFSAGFAFKYRGKMPEPLLKGKKALVFITSGAPSFLIKTFMGNMPAKLIGKNILGFTGIKTKVYLLGSSRELTEKRKLLIMNMVGKAFDKFFD